MRLASQKDDAGDKAMSRTLKISPRTVQTHFANIERKLGVHGRAAALSRWLKQVLRVVLALAGTGGFMNTQAAELIWKHPETVTGIAVDDGWMATSCFDGQVRLFDSSGALHREERRGSQLQCVAMRQGLIATGGDFDYAIAITDAGQILLPTHVTTMATVRGMSADGRYAVSDNLMAHRVGSFSWVCVPAMFGQFAWPLAVATGPDGNAITTGLDGYVRWWSEAGQEVRAVKVASSCNALDARADGTLVVSDWDMGVTVISPTGGILKVARETCLIRAVRWLPDGQIAYGTHDGRLMRWDGVSDIYVPPVPEGNTTPKRNRRK